MKCASSFVLVALLAACGGDGSSGGDDPVPAEPVFAGLRAAEVDPRDPDSVRLSWDPATDDVTPPERLVYELLVFVNRDDALPFNRFDVTGKTEFVWGNLSTNNVHWFAIEVRDEDGHAVGADLLKPAVMPTAAPRLQAVTPETDAAIAPGTKVQVTGEYLLDEPMFEGALTVGGVAIPNERIAWSSRKVEFEAPRDQPGGAIVVTTPFGAAEAPRELRITPPGPSGTN